MANTSGVSAYLDSGSQRKVLAHFSEIADSNRTMATALLLGAKTVTNSAKRKVPVRTGTLRRSIHEEVEDGGLSVLVGTDVTYARYVEQGTSRQRSQPYLLPALTENKTRVINQVNRAYRQLLKGA